METCVKCEGNLITPEVEFIKKMNLQGEIREEIKDTCWRCYSEYWGGIESIFNQFNMNKHEVFSMIENHIMTQLEDEELDEEQREKVIQQYDKLYTIPFKT